MSKNQKINRRRALRGLVGGATLPAIWSAPVIQSVVLPAHATTTGIMMDMDMDMNMPITFFGTNLPTVSVPRQGAEEEMIAKLLEGAIPSAQAQTQMGRQPRDVAITVDNGMAEVSFRNGPNTEEFGGTVSTDGTPGTVDWVSGCNIRNGSRGASIINYTDGDSSIRLRVESTETSWQVDVPMAPILPFAPFSMCPLQDTQ